CHGDRACVCHLIRHQARMRRIHQAETNVRITQNIRIHRRAQLGQDFQAFPEPQIDILRSGQGTRADKLVMLRERPSGDGLSERNYTYLEKITRRVILRTRIKKELSGSSHTMLARGKKRRRRQHMLEGQEAFRVDVVLEGTETLTPEEIFEDFRVD